MIRISRPDLGPEAEALVLEVVRSGRLSQGPMIERFEALCAEMAGVPHAIAMANGTVTIEAVLEALGIGPGTEVITTPLTFAATVNAVLRRGATVRFADVAPDYTLDPGAAAALVNARTAALLPVHLYGLMADMPSLSAIAARHGLALVEDAAQAHGASVGGRRAGSFGTGSFSFYATKNVTAGEGGAVTTGNEALAGRLRLLRNQGMAARYGYEIVGTNLRMSELQAAIAIPQLERLEEVSRARAANAAVLSRLLGRVESVVLPLVPEGRVHVWHQFTILLPEEVDRGLVVERLAAAGIEAGVYYPRLVWDYPPYREHPQVVIDETPLAAGFVARCLSLPVHQGLPASDVERVAAAAAAAISEARAGGAIR